jgi:hypothetical protein
MGHVAREEMHARGPLIGKPEGKRPRGRPKRRREDNIKVDPKEILWDVDWFYVAVDRGK